MEEDANEDGVALKPIPFPTEDSGSDSAPLSISPRGALPGPESPGFGPPLAKEG